MGGEPFRETLGHGRAGRGEIDDDFRCLAVSDAIGTEQDFMHDVRHGQADQHDFGLIGDIERAHAGLRALGDHGGERFAGDVMHDDGQPGRTQARAHACAHAAQANETNLAQMRSPMGCSGGRSTRETSGADPGGKAVSTSGSCPGMM